MVRRARAERSARDRLRGAAVVIAAATAITAHAEAAAQAPEPVRVAEHVTLRWDAPDPECPDQSELASRLRSLLGADPVQLAASARVQRLPAPGAVDEWRLDLELRWAHRDDLRTLHAADCRSLADATVVLVAVLAAPLAAARRFVDSHAKPADAPPELRAPEIAAPPAAPAAESPPASPRSSLRWPRPTGPFMRIAAALGLGALPGGDFGVTVAAGGRLPRVRLEAAATFLSPREVSLSDASGRGGTISLAAVAARACPRFLGGALELSLCGSLEAGVVPARSVGYDPQRRSQGPWLAFGLGAAIEWWFSSQVALHAGAEGLVAPVLTTYRLDDERLFTQRRLGLRAGLGLTIALTSPRDRGRRTAP